MSRRVTDNSVVGSSRVQQAGGDIHGIPIELHAELLQNAKAELRNDLEAKFAESKRADAAGKKILKIQIQVLIEKVGELERQLANPEAAYQESLTANNAILALLMEGIVEFGSEQLLLAQEALAIGDYTLADSLFSKIEQRRKIKVLEAARASFGRGEIAAAEVRWQDAADHYGRAARLSPSFDALRKASEFAWRAGHYSKALNLGDELLSLAEEEGDLEHLGIAINNRAIYLFAVERFEEAEVQFRQSLEIGSKTLGVSHWRYASRLNNFGRLLDEIGRHDEAEQYFREAISIMRDNCAEDKPLYALALKNLAAVLSHLGRYEEAQPFSLEALSVRRRVLGPKHPDYAHSLNSHAGLLEQTGRTEDARPLLLEALAVFETTLGTDNPNTQTVLQNLNGFSGETDR